MNTHSGNVNTDSGNLPKSVHVQPGITVHVRSVQVFTFVRNRCSPSSGICTSEVVRESLRLLEEQEKNKAALRRALIAGEKSGIAGPIDLDKIKAAGRAILKSKRKSA